MSLKFVLVSFFLNKRLTICNNLKLPFLMLLQKKILKIIIILFKVLPLYAGRGKLNFKTVL